MAVSIRSCFVTWLVVILLAAVGPAQAIDLGPNAVDIIQQHQFQPELPPPSMAPNATVSADRPPVRHRRSTQCTHAGKLSGRIRNARRTRCR